jgi:hypothetical protein
MNKIKQIKTTGLLLVCILILFTLYPDISHSQYLRYEVVQGDTISILRFPNHDKVDVQINSTVEVNKSINYNYSLTSEPTSEQNIYDFKIITESNISDISSPKNWSSFTEGTIPGISWGAIDSTNMLAPRKSLSGFSFTSDDLPSITNYSVRGWAPVPRVEVEPDSIENYSYSDDSKKGFTIGPGIQPGEIVPNTHIDSIQAFLDRSCTELEWITNQGICRSLEAKLDNVQKQLGRGNTKAASGPLRAFLNELEALNEKKISSEAYALLYFNGQYLLEQITQ